MAQFGRPISDIQNTSITGTFADIDETTASDSDFLYSADNADTIYECGLTTSLLDPLTGDSHTIRYRVAEIDGGVLGNGGGSTASVIVSLRQGATVIATDSSRNGTSSWTTYVLNLSTTEANNITDYTDLRLYFNITGGGGSPTNRRGIGVSWGEFELPERITIFDASITLTMDNTISESGFIELDSILTLSTDNSVSNNVDFLIDTLLTLSSENTLENTSENIINKAVILSTDNTFDELGELNLNSNLSLDLNNTLENVVGTEIPLSLNLTTDNALDNILELFIDKTLNLTTDNSLETILDFQINVNLDLTTDNSITNTQTVDFNPTLDLLSDNSFDENNITNIDGSTLLTSDIIKTMTLETLSDALTILSIATTLSAVDAITYLNTTSISSDHTDLYEILATYLNTLTLPINISQTSTVITEFIDSLGLNINITDIYNVDKSFFDILEINSDNTFSVTGEVRYNYYESVNINALIKLQSGGRKTHLFTITNIGVIKNIGKIK